MPALRFALVIATLVSLVAAPLLVQRSNSGSEASAAYAAAPDAPINPGRVFQNGNNNDNDGNGNGNGNGNDNGGNGNDNGDGDNDNGDGDNGNGNDNDADVPAPAAPAAPSGACSTPGRETVFTSGDGRVAVRVFPTMTRSVQFSVRPIDPATVPPVPGQLVDLLVFELVAQECGGGAIGELPAEINVGLHYSDAEATGLSEANFALALLDSAMGQWQPVAKQANDPPNNYVSMTTTRPGVYAVHQRP